ncbi:hypothetical protein GKZ28_00865 [Clostridium chromiireducens]|uniref:Uncharacterized protein n=1 Tax=Clostridium chromiireducens TaxID=225345 RepID=A0A964RIH8_9CLOT|nr:hypothetical protein [Clostridium chromiireducens]MVX62251.1 hypothetical protein [Clostridium chromiireducens]
MKYIAFKCCECGVINVFDSYRSDGNRCMKCGGYLAPIGQCVIKDNKKNVLGGRITVDTTDIDTALKKINLLNDRMNDVVLRMREFKSKSAELDAILKSSVISDKNVCVGMTKVIIQSNCRIRENDLEEMERKLSEKLGIKVVILNSGFEIAAIEAGVNNG